jgi:cytochrome c5
MNKLMMALTFSLASVAFTAQADDGQATYNQYCMACHGTGVGPMAGSKDLWQPRLDAKGGVDGLLESAKTGLNAMPPMGTCMDCTDEQLRAAIVFMTTFK